MNDHFEAIWRLYRHGKARPALVGDGGEGTLRDGGENPRYPFDTDVKVGDIRIFADANKPFIALVLQDRGLLGFRIVPVSPFTESASEREITLGGRVYQSWNVAVAARKFVVRSWLVDTLDKSGLEYVRKSVNDASPGRIHTGDSTLAHYEREFLVSGGTFTPPCGQAPRPSGVLLQRIEWPKVGRFAASVAICLGAFYLILGPAREKIGVWREKSYELAAMEGIEPLELAATEESVDSQNEKVEDLSVFADFSPEKLACQGPVPDPAGPVPMKPLKGQSLVENTRRVAAIHFMPIHRPDEGSFENPYIRPLSVLETGAFGSLANIPAGENAGGDSPRKIKDGIDLSGIIVRTVGCPWNPEALLLNVKACEVADGYVEVFFDKSLVRAYRTVGGGGSRPLDAWYEFLPVAGAEPGAEFCRVTVRSPSPGGDRRRIVRIRQAEPQDFELIPSPGRPVFRPAASADTNDVPVEVTNL